MMNALAQLNSLLNQPDTFIRNAVQLTNVAQVFIAAHEDKGCITGELGSTDEFRPVLAAIGDPSAVIPADLDILMSTILKVLLRKATNRLSLGKYGMTAIIRSLNRIQNLKNIPAAAEMCNVILNTCYEGVNVHLLIELDGVAPLLQFLKCKETAILCSSLGALQGMCYVPRGRQYLRQNPKVKILRSSVNCDVTRSFR